MDKSDGSIGSIEIADARRLDPIPSGLPDLTGLAVGVSGGGGHLGSEIALGLARLGAHVVAFGRKHAPLEKLLAAARECGAGARLRILCADARSSDDLTRVLDALEQFAGCVNGWVNNAYAGPSGGGSLLGDLRREPIEECLSRGLADAMLATDAAASRMREAGGSIVNIASMYGCVSAPPPLYASAPELHSPPAYGAAKAGLIQFTRYAAVHYAARGVRVNAVSPGPFPNEAVQARPEFSAALAARVPLGRIGSPRELLGPVAFLLSESASFVTGHNLVVDGGWTAW